MKDPTGDFGTAMEQRLREATAEEKKSRTGRVMLYLDPELHDRFKRFCQQRGLSMNRAATIAIETMVEHYSKSK